MVLESKNVAGQHILDLVNTYLSRLGGFKLTMYEKQKGHTVSFADERVQTPSIGFYF